MQQDTMNERRYSQWGNDETLDPQAEKVFGWGLVAIGALVTWSIISTAAVVYLYYSRGFGC